MTFIRYYLSMVLSGGEHSTAVSYARNMVTARKQRRQQDQWRKERREKINCPF